MESGIFLQKLSTELPYDPAIPFLGIYPRELKTGAQKDTLHERSLHHYSQKPKDGNNPTVHQWMNG